MTSLILTKVPSPSTGRGENSRCAPKEGQRRKLQRHPHARVLLLPQSSMHHLRTAWVITEVHIYITIAFINHCWLTIHVLLCFRMNLYELIKKNHFQGFNLPLIRRIAYALLKCLCLTFKERIIHCDMKPVRQTSVICFLFNNNTLVLWDRLDPVDSSHHVQTTSRDNKLLGCVGHS